MAKILHNEDQDDSAMTIKETTIQLKLLTLSQTSPCFNVYAVQVF